MQAKLIVIAALVAVASANSIKFSLAGKDFAPGDMVWGDPDPKVEVYYGFGSNGFSLVGKTATLHTKNPVWVETFTFSYVEHLDQKVQFKVIEEDAFSNDLYATITVPMIELLNAGTITKNFGKGTLIINPA